MVVEVLYDSQEWRVEFPNEDVYRDRMLATRRADGRTENLFRYCDKSSKWIGYGTFGYGLTWPRLLMACMEEDWTLVSLPPTGDDQ